MKKLLLSVITAIFLISCGGTSERGGLTGRVAIDGSSTVYPITEAIAEEYIREHPSVRITVGTSGSGGGFQKFAAGEIDIADASRPIQESEIEKLRTNGYDFIELPVAFDGLSIVVNPKNDWADNITVDELRRMWRPEAQGKITRWNQIRDEWPDRELNLYGPGVSSGTFDYFTAAIIGREGASRGDYTASEDDNVLVQGVSGDINSLGFFGFAYYHENQDRLKVLPVNDNDPANGEGPIVPSFETIGDGTYQPLSRPLFMYVRVDAAEDTVIQDFIHFYYENAPELVREVGFIPLNDTTYSLAVERFEERVTGSIFAGGSQVGVNVDSLLRAR